MAVTQIIIDFPEPVDLGEDQRAAIAAIAQWIAEGWTGAHPGRLMWAHHVGQPFTGNPLAVADGEPVPTDDRTFLVACAVCDVSGEFADGQASAQGTASALAWGRPVERCRGSYSGPGRVRGWALTEGGGERVVVGHVIEGGKGELLHIYAPADVRPLPLDGEGE